jgi:replication-associated recombination protein RarA
MTTVTHTSSSSSLPLSPLFVKTFQPQRLDDFSQSPEMVSCVRTLLALGTGHVLLMGGTTTGKTSMLQAIVRDYFSDVDFGTSTPNHVMDQVLYVNNCIKEQGIQYCRTDVKTFCQTRPLFPGKKKVVVLDDLDFMAETIQQVFRQYMDQYGAHVCVLASCSNTHKVIEPIQSRCTMFRLQPLSRSVMHTLLRRVTGTQRIRMDADAESFVLDVCQSTPNQMLHYLEQMYLLQSDTDPPISLALAMQVCANISFVALGQYTDAMVRGDLCTAVARIQDMEHRGYSIIDILDTYFCFVKITTTLSETQKYTLITLLCKYICMFNNVHEHTIELVLFTHQAVQALASTSTST